MGISAGADAPPACAAKTESCRVTRSLSQEGHGGGFSPSRRMIFSYWVPQASHLNSKIGIASLSNEIVPTILPTSGATAA